MPLLPAIDDLYSANRYQKHRVFMAGTDPLAAVFYFADGATLTRYYNDKMFVTIYGDITHIYSKKMSKWKMSEVELDSDNLVSYLYESELNDTLQSFIEYHQPDHLEEMPR